MWKEDKTILFIANIMMRSYRAERISQHYRKIMLEWTYNLSDKKD